MTDYTFSDLYSSVEYDVIDRTWELNNQFTSEMFSSILDGGFAIHDGTKMILGGISTILTIL